MVFEYTRHDIDNRLNGIKLEIHAPDMGRADILFQFPPKLKTDNKGANWDDRSAPDQGDAIAVVAVATPREMSLDFSYIVDPNSGWPASVIQTQLRRLRGYFFNSNRSQPTREFVINLLVWGMGGRTPVSFRSSGVSIKHSDSMVGSGLNAYHLRTDVSLSVKSYPRQTTQNFDGLLEFTNEWY